MDPKQVPPQVGVNSGSVGSSATGSPVFANPANGATPTPTPTQFQDTNPKGDIIIPPSDGSGAGGAKSPLNKKLIIGIIAGVVVLAVAIVLVIVLTGGNKSSKSGGSTGGSSVVEDASVAEKFNKYANFIISGEASSDRMPNEDELSSYEFVAKVEEHDEDFMNQAKEYFDEFYTGFEESESDNFEFSDSVENYKRLFDFVYAYSKMKPLSSDDIADMVTEDGLEATKSEIDKHYAGLLDASDAPLAIAYVKAITDYDKAIAENPNTENKIDLREDALKKINEALRNVVFDCYIIDAYLYEDTDSTVNTKEGTEESSDEKEEEE